MRNVYGEMFLQICRMYPGLSDAKTLTISEIRSFYDGLENELIELTKPRSQ
jgi:hypothetical protein